MRNCIRQLIQLLLAEIPPVKKEKKKDVGSSHEQVTGGKQGNFHAQHSQRTKIAQ